LEFFKAIKSLYVLWSSELFDFGFKSVKKALKRRFSTFHAQWIFSDEK